MKLGSVHVSLFALVFVGVMATAWLGVAVAPMQTSSLASVQQAVLVDLANQTRAVYGVQPLQSNELLKQAAQQKANDMATHNYFSHDSSNGWEHNDWISATGYQSLFAGENLAVRFHNAKDIHNAWLSSRQHKNNIVSARYTDIGVATAVGNYKGHPTTFVVQMFATAKYPDEKITSALPPSFEQNSKKNIDSAFLAQAISATSMTESSFHAPQLHEVARNWWVQIVANPLLIASLILAVIGALVCAWITFKLLAHNHSLSSKQIVRALLIITLIAALLLLRDAILIKGLIV